VICNKETYDKIISSQNYADKMRKSKSNRKWKSYEAFERK